ncbi:hypothetical protein K2173_002153 [Erythroxylum novogranatense]|uniref:DUF4378 domain-containing protein n=1 Tax=Erythroxylum novogranatense TaxID=1862640 RepID=A0AAV8SQB5_9ROSI|nr:hypothetical protein K2173_002153 [Erythroxylum novogranatense]
MGKNLQLSESGLSVPRSRPGCMWGILHILKYQRWHIKRRLAYKRGDGNNVKGLGNFRFEPGKAPRNSKEDIGDGKKKQSTSLTKGSVKSRLKALITEELSRRKGRHRRSSSYPERIDLMRNESFRRLEHSDDTLHANGSNDGIPRTVDDLSSHVTDQFDPVVMRSFGKQNFEDFDTECTGNHSEHTEVDNTGKLLIDQDFILGKEFSEHNLVGQTKDMLDALDMINMNKEFFLEILQDPDSSLAHHFLNEQASNELHSDPSKLKKSQEGIESQTKEGNLTAYRQTKLQVEPNYGQYSRSNSMPSIAAGYRTDGILKCSENPPVVKRFKNLKQKIRHAIKESKKEKHRIARDAVLHKIPHGHEFSRDLKMEDIDHIIDDSTSRDGKDIPGSSNRSNQPIPSKSKSELRCMRRTASLSESLDKYCQLYNSSLSREAKSNNSDALKLRNEYPGSPNINTPKFMGRNFSMPTMKSYFYRSEDSSEAFSPSRCRTGIDDNTSLESDCSEQRSVGYCISSENLLKLDAKGRVRDDISDSMDSETFSYTGDLGITSVSNIEPYVTAGLNSESFSDLMTEPCSVPLSDSEFQEDTSHASFSFAGKLLKAASESNLENLVHNRLGSLGDQLRESRVEAPTISQCVDDEKLEFPSKKLGDDTLHFQVDAKDKADFDYVREILELSGFTQDEELGTWHSDEQPVDPSLFQEMIDCMLLDPESSGNEEGDNFYYLLLFDLINEVLMDIYAKSYSFYPIPLSSLSKIRPMPMGQHVLKEVWGQIRWYMNSSPGHRHYLDYILSKDLAKSDGWMNLQFDMECVGLELEDMIFDDLLDEVV